jgi:hypothetical protein
MRRTTNVTTKIAWWVGLIPLSFVIVSLKTGGASPSSKLEMRRYVLPQSGLEEGDSLALLLDGVRQIAAPGVPGPFSIYGRRAFAVVVGRTGSERAPVVAAARLGKGHAFAFGHTGYFDKDGLNTADTGRLMLNALRWAAGKAEPRVGVRQSDGLLAWLQSQNVQAQPLTGNWLEMLSAFDLLCLPQANLSNREIESVIKFVQSGGGLVTSGLGWGWSQLNPAKNLQTEHSANRILAHAGIVYADGTLDRTAPQGFDATALPSEFCHAGRALRALVGHGKGTTKLDAKQISQVSSTLLVALRSVPPNDETIRPRFRQLFEDATSRAIPTHDKPLTAQGHPLDRLALTWHIESSAKQPPENVKALPSAAEFPGVVPPDAKTVTRDVEVDAATPDWHSTGLYAPAGKVVTVEVPPAAAKKGLRLRIGCHTDGLWGSDRWRRAPQISRSFPLDQSQVKTASAFGGLVYVEVPRDANLGVMVLRIRGAVDAPFFALGKTDAQAWRSTIRHHPAPWAELATRKVVLSVPSRVVRSLDDPEDLMKFWDRAMDACAELAGRALHKDRPERYVCDEQISAGYMHSGYPIMMHLDVAETVVDQKRIMTNGHGGVWGFFHEIGHNYQVGDWTFSGTGEVTNNLFALYVLEKACGWREPGHPAIKPDVREKRLKDYLAGGADFNKWKSDPFLALTMYLQLQEAFGWEAFKKVFAEYRDLPADQRPKTDAEKRDQWMTRFSKAVGRNLAPFFEAWGVPTSPQARESIAHLPAWTPEKFPSS